MGQLTLYTSEEEEDEDIIADIGPGYDVLWDNLKNDYETEDELKQDLFNLVEQTLVYEMQQMDEGDEINELIARLIKMLQDTDEIDVDRLVENSIHNLSQAA